MQQPGNQTLWVFKTHRVSKFTEPLTLAANIIKNTLRTSALRVKT